MKKEFETLDQLMNDEIFKQNFKSKFELIINERKHRPEPKEGFRYKRDWYDKMLDNGHLYREFFLINIESIINKKSELSMEYRRIIKFVFDSSVIDTIIHYEQQTVMT